MYRSKEETTSSGDLVTVRTYLNGTEAELARARLEGSGIRAFAVESASYNPIINDLAGGSRLLVGERDLIRARAILAADDRHHITDDAEGDDVVRCPECELAYCFYGQPPPTSFTAVPAVLIAIFSRLVSKKRWYCHRCGNVWDDPKAGPKAMTPLLEDDPRPVFALRRTHLGMGLFLGVMIAVLGGIVSTGLGPKQADLATFVGLASLAAPLVGLLVGRAWTYSVCSEPSCRAPLPSDAEECEKCRGSVAGEVKTAEEHYRAAAGFRRELAKMHAKDNKKKLKKKKKKKAPSQPAELA